MKVPAVVDVHDLHIWQITMGKTLLACHVRIETDADSDEVRFGKFPPFFGEIEPGGLLITLYDCRRLPILG